MENFDLQIINGKIINTKLSSMVAAQGYIRNAKLHRRFITSQFIRLNKYYGKSECVNDVEFLYKKINSSYRRVYSLLCELVNEYKSLYNIEKLANKNDDYFNVRQSFYNIDSIKEILKFISNNLYNTSGYNLNAFNIKLSEIYEANDISSMYQNLVNLKDVVRNQYKRLCHEDCELFTNVYASTGAYYTLDNLIKYSGLILKGTSNKDESLDVLERSRIAYLLTGRKDLIELCLTNIEGKRTLDLIKYNSNKN